jgi:hypothetical protein
MGYETKLYIGFPSHKSSPEKRIRITNQFEGQSQGAVFTLYKDKEGDGHHFYLADGDTRISVECALKSGAAELLPEVGTTYFSEIAMIEMCKIGEIKNKLTDKDIICWNPVLYGTGGNAMMTHDCYGDYLVAYDAKAVLQALRDMSAEDKGKYWRYAMAIACLETILEKASQSPIGVVCFGH